MRSVDRSSTFDSSMKKLIIAGILSVVVVVPLIWLFVRPAREGPEKGVAQLFAEWGVQAPVSFSTRREKRLAADWRPSVCPRGCLWVPRGLEFVNLHRCELHVPIFCGD